MRTPFAPVETFATQGRTFGAQTVKINLKTAEEGSARSAQIHHAIAAVQQLPQDQAIKKPRSHFTGEVIVTNAGVPQSYVVRSRTDPQLDVIARKPYQRCERMDDVVSCQSEVFVAPLLA